MPRGFSEQERSVIRGRLLAHGRELLASYGVRKTSVDELTAAAGISKGAFYAFFESKEELFFCILEEFELGYRKELLGLVPGEGAPRERLRGFFQQAVTLWRSDPLFRRFGGDEYAYLARKIAPERMRAQMEGDRHFAADLLGAWAAAGVALDCSPEVLTGLMRALFFVDLHHAEIEAFPTTLDLLTDALATRLAAAV